MNISEVYIGNLLEVGSSTIRRSKSSKRRAFAGKASMSIAKKRKDPLYEKYKRFNNLRMQIKLKLMKKYASKGKSYAMKHMH